MNDLMYEINSSELARIRPGSPLPFRIYNSRGAILASKGSVLSEQEIKQIVKDAVYMPADQSLEYQADLLIRMKKFVQRNVSLGDLVILMPESKNLILNAIAEAPDIVTQIERLESRLSVLLRDPGMPGWQQDLQRIVKSLLDLVEVQRSETIFVLMQFLRSPGHNYSSTRSLLVAAIAISAASSYLMPESNELKSLVSAALTMNISIAALQDAAAISPGKLTKKQQAAVENRGIDSTRILFEQLKIADNLWINSILRFQSAPPTSLYEHQERVFARLLYLADIYVGTISPRAGRPGRLSTDAAHAVWIEKNRDSNDEIGSLILKSLGIYLPGTFVKLNNGEIAVVVGRYDKTVCPQCVSIISPSGSSIIDPIFRDCRTQQYAIAHPVHSTSVKHFLNIPLILKLKQED